MSCTETNVGSAMFTFGRFFSTHLDDSQRQSLFHSLKKSAQRWDPKPKNPSEQEWKEWLTEMSETVRQDQDIPSYAKTRIIRRLDKARLDAPPKGSEFAALKYYRKYLAKSKHALREQCGQMGAWYCVSAETVANTVDYYRDQYIAAPRGEKPAIPEEFTRGWKQTSPNAPKDLATIYGFWKADDPKNYTPDPYYTRFISMDLETTGLSTKDSDIIEVGCVMYDSEGNEIERWETFIRPPLNEDGVLDTGPVEVHNILPEDVADAPTFAEIAPEIERRFRGAVLIGHNVGFDTKHLRANFDKLADANGTQKFVYPWVSAADTYWKAARVNTSLPNSKLSTVAGSLGIPYTNGHRALHDAVVCGDVFFAMRRNMSTDQPE